MSSLSQDRKIWRISPVPLIKSDIEEGINLIGRYNTSSKMELLSVQQMNLSEKTNLDKQFYIELPKNSIEILRFSDNLGGIPGSIPVKLLSEAQISYK